MYIILHTYITIPTDNIPVQLCPSYYSSPLPFTSLSCFLIPSAFYIGGTRHFTSCWSLVLGESAVCCRGVIRSILATLAFLRFMAGNAITLGDLFKATPTMSAGESMKKNGVFYSFKVERSCSYYSYTKSKEFVIDKPFHLVHYSYIF